MDILTKEKFYRILFEAFKNLIDEDYVMLSEAFYGDTLLSSFFYHNADLNAEAVKGLTEVFDDYGDQILDEVDNYFTFNG